MRAPSITIAHGVCLLYDMGSHTKSFSRLTSDMPLLIYPAAMLHDRCEANDFSEYKKEMRRQCCGCAGRACGDREHRRGRARARAHAALLTQLRAKVQLPLCLTIVSCLRRLGGAFERT